MIRKSFCTIKILVILIATLYFISCKKNTSEDQIPNVPVNFTVYLSLPQYASLNSVGSHAIIPEYGYRGIIIYRRTLDEFVAYDLACPYDPTATGAKLVVDSSGIGMVDPHCGSKFSLYSGSVDHGPATRPMKSYYTQYDTNNNSVFVTNY